MRLRTVLVAITLLLALTTVPGLVPTVAAQGPTTTVVPLPEDQGGRPSIIPLPNSGREPEVQGDPGSAAQYAVMAGILLGLGAIGAFVVRDSKRNAANRTHTPAPKTD